MKVHTDMDATLELEVMVPGGSITVQVTVHAIMTHLAGYNTKCNQCGRHGTPTTAGLICGASGFCKGIMLPVGGTFNIKA